MRPKNPKSCRQIAIKAGFDPGSLSKVLAGERRPSPGAARRLEEVTGIPAADWIFACPDYLREQLYKIAEDK
ncbi:MAG: helix-turn-helix domain-containing protein [Thermodesulfobacteriota bacterium]